MKKSRCTEAQIVTSLKNADASSDVRLQRQHSRAGRDFPAILPKGNGDVVLRVESVKFRNF